MSKRNWSITLTDKKLLRSSKVRAWLKAVEEKIAEKIAKSPSVQNAVVNLICECGNELWFTTMPGLNRFKCNQCGIWHHHEEAVDG